MRLLILILFFTTGCDAIKAQSQPDQPKYMLVELYSDKELTQRDSLTEVRVYSSRMNQKDTLERRGENVFLLGVEATEKLIIEAGGIVAGFEVPLRARVEHFLVIQVHLNKIASPESVSLVVRNGDVIYVIKKCEVDCHTIRIRNPSLVQLQDSTVTTGFSQLDSLIFDKKR